VLSGDGRSVVSSSTLADGFSDPLPLLEGPDGTLYVGELGADRIAVLQPVGGAPAPAPEPAGAWTARAPQPTAVLDAGGTAVGGTVYSVAGKTSTGYDPALRIYDPATDTWTTGPPLPGPAVENPATAAVDGRLYVFGGSTGPFSGAVTNAAAYDPATQAWTVLPAMPVARGGAAAAVVGTKVHVIGGMDGSGVSLSTVSVYDTVAGTWSAGPPMTTARDNPGAAALGGMVYVFGGRTRAADGSGPGALASVEMLDPATGAWTARAAMPTGRRSMAVGLLDGRAQLMGGEGTATGGSFAANEEYDPLTDTWRALTAMPTPRHGAVAGTVDGVVYVAGGGPQGGSSYTAVTEAFTATP
jgi:large repetitive protein